MNKKVNQVVIMLAHPNMQESVANKELHDTVKDMEGVFVYDLYDKSASLFDVDVWSRILSNASLLVFQFPFHWMSAPSLLKKWQDEVFTHVANTPAVAGKPMMVVTTVGSESEAYRSGGRNGFTVDELLRPYQAAAIYSGMIWQTPLVVYGTASDDPAKSIAQGSNQYKNILEHVLANKINSYSKEWKY